MDEDCKDISIINTVAGCIKIDSTFHHPETSNMQQVTSNKKPATINK